MIGGAAVSHTHTTHYNVTMEASQTDLHIIQLV